MESFSLSKLNTYIRRALAVNFQDPIWIRCELLSANFKSGHVYLEVVEKDPSDQIIAQAAAVMWKGNLNQVQSRSPYDILQILSPGHEVLIQIQVDFHARYGLKLIIQDIDGTYTLGKIAEAKLKTIERLKQESLWQKNKTIQAPLVIQSIALIGSSSSAGYQDFLDQLLVNKYHFTFRLKRYEASMQGEFTVSSIRNAFEEIKAHKKGTFDAVVLIRGGGSKHDLLEFDDYEISKLISNCEYPVFTGIGHFIDESLADLSAYKSLKTPTAVSEEIIQTNANFEALLESQFTDGMSSTLKLYQLQLMKFQNLKEQINLNFHQVLNHQIRNVDSLKSATEFHSWQILNTNKLKLSDLLLQIESNDPISILAKGYSISFKDGKVIRSIHQIQQDDVIETQLENGIFKSIISHKWLQKN